MSIFSKRDVPAHAAEPTADERQQRREAVRIKRTRHLRAFAKRVDSDDIPALNFTGTTTFFRDKGCWHVRLADGGLSSPVRMEPRKDSPTAHAIFDAVLSAHIEAALPAVGVSLSDALGGDWYDSLGKGGNHPSQDGYFSLHRYGTVVHVGLLTDARNRHYGEVNVVANIYPTAAGIEISYYDGSPARSANEHTWGPQDVLAAVETAAHQLVASVPEFTGQPVLMVDARTQSQPKINNTDRVEVLKPFGSSGGWLALALPMGERMCLPSLVSSEGFDAKVTTGVLVTGVRNLLFLTRTNTRLQDAASEAVTRRNGTGLEVVLVDDVQESQVSDYAVRYGIKVEGGDGIGWMSIRRTSTDLGAPSAVLAAFAIKGAQVTIVIGSRQGDDQQWQDLALERELSVLAKSMSDSRVLDVQMDYANSL